MHVCVISAFPPTADNYGAPTALPYQILKYAPQEVSIDLFYFRSTNTPIEVITRDINALNLKTVVEIPLPKGWASQYFYWRARQRGLLQGVGRFPPRLSIIERVNASCPDAVWLYPHWLIDWFYPLHCKNIVVTGPDSAALHYERTIRYGAWTHPRELAIEVKQLQQSINLERQWGMTSARIHVVGQRDLEKYHIVTGRNDQAFFIPYPLHRFVPLSTPIADTMGKMRIVILGGGNTVYVGNHLQRVAEALSNASCNLVSFYEILFIGGGYEEVAKQLSHAGYGVSIKHWVEYLAEEIARQHIQIFPIAVGTGTKGKVLSGLATGLLGIGSTFAYENIRVVAGEDCLLYREPEDIPKLLQDVAQDRVYYQQMAERGASKVRVYHSPERVVNTFWKTVLGL